MGGTGIGNVAYDSLDAKQWNRGGRLMKCEMITYCLCVLHVYVAYI